MRIAILTSESYFSCRLISELLKNRHRDVVCMVITPSQVKGKGFLGTIKYTYQKSGARYLIYKIITFLWIYLAEFLYKLGFIKKCITPSNLANLYGIEIYKSQDCNSPDTINYLKSKNVDIILSINVYQRLREAILAVPNLASINNHFGLLPYYKGMAPYIWAMANDEKEIGLTVHHMVLAFDEGKIIEQNTMPIEPKVTALGVYLRGCEIAKHMICNAIAKVEKDKNAGFQQNGSGTYFSMPTRECIKKLYENGYRLWSFGDLFSILKNP